VPRHERGGQVKLLRQCLDLGAFVFGQPHGENVFPLRLSGRQGGYDWFLHQSRSLVLPIDSAYQSRFAKPLKYFSWAWKNSSYGDFEAELSEKRKQKSWHMGSFSLFYP
jgi:hypothetical protein